MTREQIEKEIDLRLDEPDCEWDGIFNSGYSRGFREGAQWRINSVWHDVSEKPENRRYILVDKEYRIQAVWKQDVEDDWLNDVNYFGVTRWAYVSDLLPERKEGTE